MFCKKCGMQLDNDAVFCSSCGCKVGQSVDAQIVETAMNNMSAPRTHKNALVCEMCSGTLIKDNGLFVCESCGTRYTVEEARNLIEVSGHVKIDNSDEVINLYTLARRAVDSKNYDMAQRYYDQLLVKDPNNWEPNFYSLYCQVYNSSIDNMMTMAKRVDGSETAILNMLASDNCDRKEKFDQLRYITDLLLNLSTSYSNGLNSTFRRCSYNPTTKMINKQPYNYYKPASYATMNILYYLGDRIIEIFGVDYAPMALDSWKRAIDITEAFHHEVSIYAGRGMASAYARKDIGASRQVVAKYNEKIYVTINSYRKRCEEANRQYWENNAFEKSELQKEYTYLQTKNHELLQQRDIYSNNIRLFRANKADVKIMFNRDEKNIIQSQIDDAVDHVNRLTNEMNANQNRMKEIENELNRNRLFA